MNTELIATIGTIVTALLSSTIGPIIVHYTQEKFKGKKSKDPLGEAIDVNLQIVDKIEKLRLDISADRITLLQFHNGGYFYPTGKSIQKMSAIYESKATEVSSCKLQLQGIPVSLFSRTVDKLKSDEVVSIPDVKNNPNMFGITNSFADADVKGTYIFPIRSIKNDFIGIFIVDRCKNNSPFTDDEIKDIEIQIATISGVLFNYLKK